MFLCEVNCIKIQTMSLVLNLFILAEIFCVIYFDVITWKQLEKEFKPVELSVA